MKRLILVALMFLFIGNVQASPPQMDKTDKTEIIKKDVKADVTMLQTVITQSLKCQSLTYAESIKKSDRFKTLIRPAIKHKVKFTVVKVRYKDKRTIELINYYKHLRYRTYNSLCLSIIGTSGGLSGLCSYE